MNRAEADGQTVWWREVATVQRPGKGGLGLFGMGVSAAAAGIAADIAENTVAVVTAAESVGRFASITPAQTFAMEYWSLEQAKLGRAAEKRLQRQVVVVTGGARGIPLP